MTHAQETPSKKIVLIHGLTGDSAGWSTLESSLKQEGYELILFDLPGHGGTRDDLKGVTWQDWVDSVQTVIDRESQDGKVAVFGHSMGGLLAVYVGNLPGNEAKIAKTITFAAAFQDFSLSERIGIFFAPIIQYFRPYYQVTADKEMPFVLLQDYLAVNKNAKKAANKNVITQLSLHGTRDASIPVEEARKNLEGKPKITFKTVDQPHYPENEAGFEEISQHIVTFLAP
ncbi:MAG: alpha/beta fold hydrolase [bacterium]|nr:alpha/beta fold hydrolase [bacterium]